MKVTKCQLDVIQSKEFGGSLMLTTMYICLCKSRSN